jgi:hypoxanthine phosphoribosyltransferase
MVILTDIIEHLLLKRRGIAFPKAFHDALEYIRVGCTPLFNFMKKFVTSADFCRMVSNLCAQLAPIRSQFEWIVGVERGGIPISTFLSYALDKKHDTISISFYGENETPNNVPLINKPFVPSKYTSPILIVDDIVDTGRTIDMIRGLADAENKRIWVATLHWCEDNSPNMEPDFYVEKKSKDCWIVYPWEMHEIPKE